MKPLIALRAAAILAAVALPAASRPAAAQPAGRSCFWIRNIQNMRSLDEQTVFARTTGRDVWALDLFSRCVGIGWPHRTELRSRASNFICEGRTNILTFYLHNRRAGRRRCAVTDVRKLTPAEVAALPPRARP